MFLHQVSTKFYLVYPGHLNKEQYSAFIMTLPAYECSFWIAHQFNKQNGKPVTRVLLNFGLMGFHLHNFDSLKFQDLKPASHRMLDHLSSLNWRRFLCRFGRDETCPLTLAQPWFANALVYIRRQSVIVKQTNILNLYSSSGQAHLRQFSQGIRQFYSHDTIVLDNVHQFHQLTTAHRSILIHLSNNDLQYNWIEVSTLLQQLRTGQVTGHIPQSILLLSHEPMTSCGKLFGGLVESMNLDRPSMLGEA
jgi:hypothetical protein